ncbi:HET-domain-containing protein [Lentithecium fluviatile CBS 122367]|uniref:HET-domain-containing protein n=1 Tax=Lentithecium fluviatile CBS 122367 TaxID=1168545 RepID=A0A6G1IBW7_9PLEO|nr:HET-domain-containing protein [Lentithecium fluviatile CBS 122367]
MQNRIFQTMDLPVSPVPPSSGSQSPVPTAAEAAELAQSKKRKIDSVNGRGPFLRRLQACQACKERKVRCDGKKPSCSHCSQHAINCAYYSRRDLKPGDRQDQMDTETFRILHPPKRSSPPTIEFSGWMKSPSDSPPALLPFDPDSPPKPTLYEKQDTPPSFEKLFRNEYMYTSIVPHQIRLLLLSKGRLNEPIHCSLKIMEYSKLEAIQIVYQALSYAWGDDIASYEIFLQDISVPSEGLSREDFYQLSAHQAVPKRFYVRPNLCQALRQLRSESQDLWLWIDALCIDQNNDAEKSHQIPKMLGIYSNALNVCIWVGESGDTDEGQKAMDFIPSIVNLKLLDRMTTQETPDEKIAASWAAFASILRRPWFRRRWVIQEVAASRNASVQCGNRSMNWIDFADAVQLFTTKIERIRALYDNSELSKMDPDALSHVESAGATAIVNATSNVLRRTQSGSILDRIWNIESLVMRFLHFEASDPRDAIFALLSLASDGHLMTNGKVCSKTGAHLTPDYTKPALQTYIEFLQHCIAASGSLNIICRHWALPLLNQDGLPSWIGLVKDSPFGAPSRLAGRLNGDSLVGTPGKSTYNASRGRPPLVHFGREGAFDPSVDAGKLHNVPSIPSLEQAFPDSTSASAIADEAQPAIRSQFGPTDASTGMDGSLFTGTLYAKGIMLSRISRVSSRVVDGTISDDCLAMAGWNAGSDVNNIPDRLWRTLVADRAADGTNAPFWYRRACMYCLHKASPDGDLNTSKLIANRSLPETVLEYLKRVQSIVWSRKFLVCRESHNESEWLFGLGSRHIENHDLVCILFGCSVPVILRYHEDPEHYEFIGECYIHGKMDGEALAGLDEDTIANSTLEFNII